MQKISNKHAGFSLVELAISVTIIGILIAGVVKGQDVIKNAQVVSTIATVDKFSKAHRSFYDVYAALPGDISTAQSDLLGCGSGNTNNCASGNGDGIIGDALQGISGVAMGEDVSGNSENVMYWKHLALAGMIEGVDPSASIDPDDFEAGVTHPKTAPSSTWTIAYSALGEGGGVADGHILRQHRQLVGDIPNGSANQSAHIWQPVYARNIDIKTDDGYPSSGKTHAEYSGSLCEITKNGVEQYNIAVTTKACWMIFLVTE